MENLTRRSFVKAAGAAGLLGVAAGAVAGTAGADETADTQAASSPTGDIFYTSEKTAEIGVLKDPDSTEDVDLVAVGSGMAGLAAACMAKDLMPDANVVLLEKASVWGGISRYTDEPHHLPKPNATLEEAIELATEKADASSNGCDKNLYMQMYMEQGDNSSWLMGKMGVKVEYTPVLWGGDTVCYEGGTGESMVSTMVANAERLGVDMRSECRATALVTSDPHTVTGIQYKDADGKIVQLNCKAVVLGAGCVSSNPELVKQLYPLDPDTYTNFGLPYDEGDGQVMVQATAHGRIREISYAFKDYALGTSFTDVTPNGNLLAAALCREPTDLHVNGFGVRTHDESVYAPKVLTHQAYTFSIFGSYAIDQYVKNGLTMNINLATCDYVGNPVPMNDLLDEWEGADWLYKADTIEELGEQLAAKFDTFDVDAFVKQVEDYDSYAENGADLQYGKPAEFLWPIGDGPYYAAQVLPVMLHAGGGVDINTDAQVIDPQGRPIQGLYASGNNSGPWCGEVYITGAGQPNALWCSSRAVRHAMKNVFGQDVPEDWMGDVKPEDIEIPVGTFPEQYAHVEVDTETGRAVK